MIGTLALEIPLCRNIGVEYVTALQTPVCVDGFRSRRYSVPIRTERVRKENGLIQDWGTGTERKTGYFSNTMERRNGKRVCYDIWCVNGNGNGIVLKPVFKYGFLDGKTT